MKRQMIYAALVASLILVFSACMATGASKKDSGAGGAIASKKFDRQYPDASYLKAIGLGQSEPEARNRAVGQLSNIFISRIKSETVDTLKSVMKDGNETIDQSLTARVEVLSNTELEGVEVPEVWKEGATHSALAVLDRQKAARGWAQKIADIDSRIAGDVAAAEGQASTLVKYKALKSASTRWAERAVYMSRMNVLNVRAPEPDGYDMKSVMAQVADIKARLRIYLDISGDRIFREGVARRLGEAGFVVSGGRTGANVLVSGNVQLNQADIANKDWKYARAIAALTVADAVTGEAVGEVSENVRASHLSLSEAKTKAVKKVTPKVSESLIRILDE